MKSVGGPIIVTPRWVEILDLLGGLVLLVAFVVLVGLVVLTCLGCNGPTLGEEFDARQAERWRLKEGETYSCEVSGDEIGFLFWRNINIGALLEEVRQTDSWLLEKHRVVEWERQPTNNVFLKDWYLLFWQPTLGYEISITKVDQETREGVW